MFYKVNNSNINDMYMGLIKNKKKNLIKIIDILKIIKLIK